MSSCVAVIASKTDAKAIARAVLQNVDMHVISVRLIGTRPEHRCEPATCSNADCIDRGPHMLVPLGRESSILPFVSFDLGSRCRSARGHERKLLIQLTSKRLKGVMIGSRFTPTHFAHTTTPPRKRAAPAAPESYSGAIARHRFHSSRNCRQHSSLSTG